MKKIICFTLLLLVLNGCDLSTSEPRGITCLFNVDDSKFEVNGVSKFLFDYVYKGDSIVEVKVKSGTGIIQKDLAFKYNSKFQLIRVVDKLTNTTEASITYQADGKWKTIAITNGLIDSAFYSASGLLERIREHSPEEVRTYHLQIGLSKVNTNPAGNNLEKLTIETKNKITGETTTELIEYIYSGVRDRYNLHHGFLRNLLSKLTAEESFMFTHFTIFPPNHDLATVLKRSITFPDTHVEIASDTLTYTFTSDRNLPISVKYKHGDTSQLASWPNLCVPY